jgi:hypothetical protein
MSTLPAIDVKPPFGIRIASAGMCSNESGIESNSTFTDLALSLSLSRLAGAGTYNNEKHCNRSRNYLAGSPR